MWGANLTLSTGRHNFVPLRFILPDGQKAYKENNSLLQSRILFYSPKEV